MYRKDSNIENSYTFKLKVFDGTNRNKITKTGILTNLEPVITQFQDIATNVKTSGQVTQVSKRFFNNRVSGSDAQIGIINATNGCTQSVIYKEGIYTYIKEVTSRTGYWNGTSFTPYGNSLDEDVTTDFRVDFPDFTSFSDKSFIVYTGGKISDNDFSPIITDAALRFVIKFGVYDATSSNGTRGIGSLSSDEFTHNLIITR